MTAATDARAPGLRFETRDAQGVCVPAWKSFVDHCWPPGTPGDVNTILVIECGLSKFGASINWSDNSHLIFDSSDSLVEFVLVWS